MALVGAAAFAVQGGEYSTADWLELRARERALQAEVDSLTREVDSLGRWAKQVESDPAVQERLARERFGMIRPGEMLYRIVGPRGE
ncbi:MAG: septum formation initiator family protein [Gemmatimonadales bacterium]|nr:septum formation initiator family protein [Gemmatimonadales bacterium]